MNGEEETGPQSIPPASGPARQYVRGYKACEECRTRKARCIFPSTGQPFKPPCERCIRSGRQCIVNSESKRGKWKRKPAKGKEEADDELDEDTSFSTEDVKGDMSMQAGGNSLVNQPLPSTADFATAPPQSWPGQLQPPPSSSSGSGMRLPSHWETTMGHANIASLDQSIQQRRPHSQGQGHQQQLLPPTASPPVPQKHSPLRRASAPEEELKNPADAFDILVHAAGQSEAPSRAVSPIPLHRDAASTQPDRRDRIYPPLEESFELIRTGQMTVDQLRHLVTVFIRSYHPFYPLLATARLAEDNLAKFAYEDPVLLPAICVVASRGPESLDLHLALWRYTKSLLTDAIWGEKQSVGAVEAMLLLSEWIGPELQKQSKNKVKDSSLVWMTVGSAVRMAYLQGLDQASAARTDSDPLHPLSKQRRELAWTWCYWSDRSISVRMGRGFWSRGPFFSSRGQSGHFPTLHPPCQLDGQDYALTLQAHLDLIQLMGNIQDVMYPTRERQVMMMQMGDYARYLDDFMQGVEAWNVQWGNRGFPSPNKETLRLSYFYLRLYLNSFAFSATMLRYESSTDHDETSSLFKNGIGKLPDSRFIITAIEAANALINTWLDSAPQGLLTCMPPRYYSFLVYAAVFLLKAVRLGALVDERAQDVGNLVEKLVDSWRDKEHPYPDPAGHYANLLDAYMLRIKLKKQRTVHAPSEVGSTPDSFLQFFSTNYLGDLAGISPNQYANSGMVPYGSHAQDFSGNQQPGFHPFQSNGISPSSLPLADWASNVENGMDGLPSLAAFAPAPEWHSHPQRQGYTYGADPALQSFSFM